MNKLSEILLFEMHEAVKYYCEGESLKNMEIFIEELRKQFAPYIEADKKLTYADILVANARERLNLTNH